MLHLRMFTRVFKVDGVVVIIEIVTTATVFTED